MGWRILQITKPCKLNVKQNQLVYEPFEGEGTTFPLEDISVLLLESKAVQINSFCLSEMAKNNIILFSCDFSHMPSGIFYPFHNYCRYSLVAWCQKDLSEPFKKQLWQSVVKAKIRNQAESLKIAGRSNSDKLEKLAKTVLSGDSKNVEALAASIYWKSLWDDFNRHDDADLKNAALNYGYAIVRGCLARFLVGAGLLPCFGIHHANQLNQFNLIDDLMEPFRPFVDQKVYALNLDKKGDLTPTLKHQLLEVLTENCFIAEEQNSFLKSCEICATAFAKTTQTKKRGDLKVPFLKNTLILNFKGE
ncbi:MAG: type II CRISPR-associated endonuclease Cas1 [Alphaproteobacteria bacterium]|nr:type II CRISPR-associated endonuclease Cas1 [Alphaproteobacteria bacterium]